MFVTVVMNVTARCTSTELADGVVVTARSDKLNRTTSVVAIDVLSPGFGSSVDEEIVAVLTIGPSDEGVRTSIWMKGPSYAATMPSLHVSVCSPSNVHDADSSDAYSD